MAGKPNTRVTIQARRDRMFDLLKLRATKTQVMEALRQEGFAGVSVRTYERDMLALRKRADEWVESFAINGMNAEYLQAVEFLKDVVRRLVIVESQSTSSRDRTEALREIRETEVQLIELLLQGPVAWSIKKRLQMSPSQENAITA